MANDILNALMNAVVNTHDNGKRKTTAVDSPNGRLGFLSRDQIPDDVVPGRYQTRYGIGIDNVGSPYRGVMDEEINTPLGVIDYGYDGDTVAAGFTPIGSLNFAKNTEEPNSAYVDYQPSYYIQSLMNLLNNKR